MTDLVIVESMPCSYSNRMQKTSSEPAAMSGMQPRPVARPPTPGVQIAPALGEHFPDSPLEVIAACIDRYRSLRLWSNERAILREGFDRLRTAMISGGAIASDAGFETCCAELT